MPSVLLRNFIFHVRCFLVFFFDTRVSTRLFKETSSLLFSGPLWVPRKLFLQVPLPTYHFLGEESKMVCEVSKIEQEASALVYSAKQTSNFMRTGRNFHFLSPYNLWGICCNVRGEKDGIKGAEVFLCKKTFLCANREAALFQTLNCCL